MNYYHNIIKYNLTIIFFGKLSVKHCKLNAKLCNWSEKPVIQEIHEKVQIKCPVLVNRKGPILLSDNTGPHNITGSL